MCYAFAASFTCADYNLATGSTPDMEKKTSSRVSFLVIASAAKQSPIRTYRVRL